MGSYQGTASAAPNCAPRPRRSGRVKLGKGTSSTRADKVAIRQRQDNWVSPDRPHTFLLLLRRLRHGVEQPLDLVRNSGVKPALW